MTLGSALVAAVISLCVGTQCETHSLRLERKMCGQRSRAEVPVNGEWQPAEARVTCTR